MTADDQIRRAILADAIMAAPSRRPADRMPDEFRALCRHREVDSRFGEWSKTVAERRTKGADTKPTACEKMMFSVAEEIPISPAGDREQTRGARLSALGCRFDMSTEQWVIRPNVPLWAICTLPWSGAESANARATAAAILDWRHERAEFYDLAPPEAAAEAWAVTNAPVGETNGLCPEAARKFVGRRSGLDDAAMQDLLFRSVIVRTWRTRK